MVFKMAREILHSWETKLLLHFTRNQSYNELSRSGGRNGRNLVLFRLCRWPRRKQELWDEWRHLEMITLLMKRGQSLVKFRYIISRHQSVSVRGYDSIVIWNNTTYFL